MSAMEEVHQVLMSGTSEAIKSILQSEINLRASLDSSERTAIHHLANNLNLGVVDVIDELFGDTTNKQNKSKMDFIKSIFFIKSSKNSQTIQSELIHWNARDKDGRTPLHHAMAAGNANFVKFLMNKGVEVNVKTANGVTPFFEALVSLTESTMQDHIECVKIIMESDVHPENDIERYLEIYNTKSAINRDFPLLEPLIAHLILRQTKGEQISEKLLQSIDCHPKLKEYVVFCKDQLDKMKQEKIDSGSATLFDFLTSTVDEIELYQNSYSYLKSITNDCSLDTYYASILRQHYSELSKKRYVDNENKLKLAIRAMIFTLFSLFILYNTNSALNSLVEIMIITLAAQMVPLSLIITTCFISTFHLNKS